MTLIEQQPGRSTEQEVEGKIPLALRHSDSDLHTKHAKKGNAVDDQQYTRNEKWQRAYRSPRRTRSW